MLPIYVTKGKSLLLRIMSMVVLTAIISSLIVPTVFARNTFVITDGEQTKSYTGYSMDPAAVLDRAGVELGEDDIYTTQPVDGVYEITVQRSQTITVYNCGEMMEVTSYGETVQELLDRLGIPSYGEYVVSQALSAETYDGMEVAVDWIFQTRQTYTVDIPYETTYCYDPTMAAGEEKVLVAGVTGQLQQTADVVYCNMEAISNTVVEETVVQQPTNAIVLVGTGEGAAENTPAIGDGVIVTADGEVLTYSRTAQFLATAYTHTDAGCDMTTATGTTVRIGTIAVDPTVIPYGTRMFIVSNDGTYIYGIGTAEDCGGAIKDHRLDLYMPTTEECFAFGARNCTVYFLD